jgi:hypothetical protein
MYHLELRQFPHNVCHFNLDERALQAIVAPWARGKVVEVGERKWNPEMARLTILEGPQLAPSQLTMGRGWRTAQRRSEDVTARVLDAAAAALARSDDAAGAATARVGDGGPGEALESSAPNAASSPRTSTPGDPFALGVQIATLLGPDAMRLLERWRAVAAAEPGLLPSEALARAERDTRANAAPG